MFNVSVDNLNAECFGVRAGGGETEENAEVCCHNSKIFTGKKSYEFSF